MEGDEPIQNNYMCASHLRGLFVAEVKVVRENSYSKVTLPLCVSTPRQCKQDVEGLQPFAVRLETGPGAFLVLQTLELLRRWRVIGELGGPAPSDELSFLGREMQEAAISQWKFLTEYVVADQEVPQEAARLDQSRNCPESV